MKRNKTVGRPRKYKAETKVFAFRLLNRRKFVEAIKKHVREQMQMHLK